MRGESGAAHTGHSRCLDAVDNLLRRQLRMVLDGLQCVCAVYAFLPLIALHADENGGPAIARGIDEGVYFDHRSRDRREDRGRDKAAGLADECPHPDLVATLYHGLGRRTDVLSQWENRRLRQWSLNGDSIVCELVLLRVHATLGKCE